MHYTRKFGRCPILNKIHHEDTKEHEEKGGFSSCPQISQVFCRFLEQAWCVRRGGYPLRLDVGVYKDSNKVLWFACRQAQKKSPAMRQSSLICNHRCSAIPVSRWLRRGLSFPRRPRTGPSGLLRAWHSHSS